MSHNRKIFSAEEETRIKQNLEGEYISKEKSLTFNLVKEIMLKRTFKYIRPHCDGTVSTSQKTLNFKCSRKFMDNFLYRNGLSNRMCTVERRPTIDENEVNRFLQILHEALNDPSDRIVLNADESQWRVLMPPRRSIAITGQDSVKININGDKKAGFTILGTIS